MSQVAHVKKTYIPAGNFDDAAGDEDVPGDVGVTSVDECGDGGCKMHLWHQLMNGGDGGCTTVDAAGDEDALVTSVVECGDGGCTTVGAAEDEDTSVDAADIDGDVHIIMNTKNLSPGR